MATTTQTTQPPLKLEEPKLVRQKSSFHSLTGQSSLKQIYISIILIFCPTFVSRLAWIGMKITDTALLGQSGTEFLTASSLADFWTSASGVFISDRVLGSLCGQAYGAKNYDRVGMWVQVSLTIFSWVFIPVCVLWCVTAPVLHSLMGTDEKIACYAGYYAIVLALCLPARIISSRLSTFFSSQAITKPSAQTTLIALVLNLGFGLQFVLGIPFSQPRYGFWACPIVTTCVEWVLVLVYLFVYCGCYKYHEKCWTAKSREWRWFQDVCLAPVCAEISSSGFTYYRETIRPNLWGFIKLALPATLAFASDFWRMSTIGLLAGMLGNKEVAVFNASYRFAWMNMTLVGSFSTACVTQLGIALGTGDGELSYKIRNLGINSVFGFLLMTIALTIYFIDSLAMIFSTDQAVIQLFVDCRWAIGGMIFFMCLSLHFESLLIGLKKTDVVFKAALAGSWLGQVPAVLLLIFLCGKKLPCIYFGVGIGYALLMVLYMIPLYRADLHEEARRANLENKGSEPLTQP